MTFFAMPHMPEKEKYFCLFASGNEKGLDYFYQQLFKSAHRYGYNLIRNEFEMNNIVQDCFQLIWRDREKITSAQHVCNYLRRAVKLRCYTYLRSPGYKFNSYIRPLEYSEYTNSSFLNQETDLEQYELELIKEESLQLIKKAIPYLCGDKKTIMILFSRGIGYKEIARQLEQTNRLVQKRAEQARYDLKKIYKQLKQAAKASRRERISIADGEIYLNGDETKVYKCYYEKKNNINQIAAQLNKTPWQVWQLLDSAGKKISSAPQKRKSI